MVTIPSQPSSFNTTVKRRVCSSHAHHSTHVEYGDEKARLAQCIPKTLPFPQERLDNSAFCSINGRDQLLAGNGSYVLTDIALLPPGGESHSISAPEPLFHTILLGDMGTKSDRREEVFNNVKSMCDKFPSQQSGLIFGLGDWLYPHGPLNNDDSETQRVKTQIIDAFANLSKHIPKYGVLGNHEYGLSSTAADPGIFMSLANTADIQFPGRYYALEIQGSDWAADCFALDTSTLACDPAQLDWFQEQVKTSKEKEINSEQKRWRIVMAHHPLVSYGLHHGETTYLTDLMGHSLQDIDLYCCGHEHDLEYIIPEGKLPPVLLSGTSSETRDVDTGPDTIFNSSDCGFATVTIDKNALNIRFHPAQGSELLHQHQIKREARGSSYQKN